MSGLALGLSAAFRRPRAAGASTAQTMALNTRLVFVGDSITNVSNAAHSGHRAYREWLNVYAKGHFYRTPGNNQGIGGATLTEQASATAYIGRRKDWWLNQVDGANTAVLFAIGTNDMANASATLAIMQSTLTALIGEVTALGGKVILATCLKSGGNQTFNANPEINLTKWTAWNTWIRAQANPAGGIYVVDAADTLTVDSTHFYDGPTFLHPNGHGARLVGEKYAADLAPYLASGTILPGLSPVAGNLNSAWDLAGTGGTAGTGTTGSVATGWSAFCSSNGTSGGSTIGVTATCSKTTVNIAGVGTGLVAQQIDISGTTSAIGVATLIDSITTNSQYKDLLESFAWVKITATDGTSAPVGVAGLGSLFGSGGGTFNKVVDANAGNITGAFEGVLRTVPIGLLTNATTQNYEVSVNLVSGPVDVRIIIAQTGSRFVETAAYKAPFNLGAAMFSGVQNPIGDRPRLNGTGGVGNVLTLQPATWSGGGMTRTTRVKRNGVTIATYAPGASPMTYTQVAGDSGTTLTMEDEATNSFGGPVIATSAGVVVP